MWVLSWRKHHSWMLQACWALMKAWSTAWNFQVVSTPRAPAVTLKSCKKLPQKESRCDSHMLPWCSWSWTWFHLCFNSLKKEREKSVLSAKDFYFAYICIMRNSFKVWVGNKLKWIHSSAYSHYIQVQHGWYYTHKNVYNLKLIIAWIKNRWVLLKNTA